jgi:hypothetical protein
MVRENREWTRIDTNRYFLIRVIRGSWSGQLSYRLCAKRRARRPSALQVRGCRAANSRTSFVAPQYSEGKSPEALSRLVPLFSRRTLERIDRWPLRKHDRRKSTRTIGTQNCYLNRLHELHSVLCLDRTNDAEKILWLLGLSRLVRRAVEQPSDLNCRIKSLFQLFDPNPAGSNKVQPPMVMRFLFCFLPFPERDAPGYHDCFTAGCCRLDWAQANDENCQPKP